MEDFEAEKLEDTEKVHFPKAGRYLEEQFSQLENDYKKGANAESCTVVATELARIIMSEGGHPRILMIRGKKIDSGGINTEVLVPKRYAGRVEWGAHAVCECEGVVYDPMIGRAVEIDTYLQDTFENEVEARDFIVAEKMEEFLKR